MQKTTAIHSFKKTYRAVVATDDWRSMGASAELAASLYEHAFDYLDAPIKRVAAIDTPIPFSPPLEEFFLPNKEKIVAALRDLAAY